MASSKTETVLKTELLRKSALRQSLARFAYSKGSDLRTRYDGLKDWICSEHACGVLTYELESEGPLASNVISVKHKNGAHIAGLNFYSVDYLGLSASSSLAEVAISAIRELGLHATSSGPLLGNNAHSEQIQKTLNTWLGFARSILFPTGWAAGFGGITGIVRESDWVFLDELAHQCLQQGAYASSQNVVKFKHLDNADLEHKLEKFRLEYPDAACLVVTEGLFSMDGDYPDKDRLEALCAQYNSALLVDVAHDLGCLGSGGKGSGVLEAADFVVGSFSKVFGTNGGFFGSRTAGPRWAVGCFGGSYTYATAFGPPQAAVAAAALEIVIGAEGDQLRAKLADNAALCRQIFSDQGLETIGHPNSPIVPVIIGNDAITRVAGALALERGLIAPTLIFPVVSRGRGRFRLSLTPNHTRENFEEAAKIAKSCIADAQTIVANLPD